MVQYHLSLCFSVEVLLSLPFFSHRPGMSFDSLAILDESIHHGSLFFGTLVCTDYRVRIRMDTFGSVHLCITNRVANHGYVLSGFNPVILGISLSHARNNKQPVQSIAAVWLFLVSFRLPCSYGSFGANSITSGLVQEMTSASCKIPSHSALYISNFRIMQHNHPLMINPNQAAI